MLVIPSVARDLGGRCERHDISCPTRPGPSLDARDDSTARLYKTGDLARYRADGAIDFIGRLDNQVKIRGFRVEPGEIEAALLAHPYLREVTVQFSSELIAYFVAEEGRRPNVSELREWLGERLPAYMIPAHWIELPSLPLNASGKIDRRALPAPGADRPELSVAYAEPRNDVESTLASIWQQLLKLDKVGRSDNFFELGGHSLLATQVVSRLRDAFGVEVPVRLLFERPTIAAMAEALSHGKSQPAATENIVRHESSGPCPLSFCQERLWFLDQLDPGTPLFNIHDVIHFAGAFDHDALEAALSEVVARHETLRTTFASVDGVPVQIVGTAEFVHIPITEVEDEYDVANWSDIESQEPFDLTTGPLFRARVIKLADDDHRLLLTLHHIVADGWSLAILRREIETLYTAPASLEELPVQYTDFSLWQRNRVNSGALSEQLEFWQRHLANLPPALELPLDRPRPLLESSLGARQTLQVPESVVAALRDLCKQKQVTTFMLMLAAFKLLIHRYTGQTDLLIGCPVAGRTRAEIENLIGFFLNTLALRTDVSGNPTFHELLDRIRETTLDTFANQDVPYEKLAQTKLFHLFFNVINFDVAGAPTEESSEPTPSRSIFDLTLYVFDQPDGLLLEAVYRTDLYEASTIRRLLQHLETILETVAKTPELHLSRFALTPHPPSAPSPLAEGRRPSQHQPSPLVKGEKVPKADEGSIPQLFEETARRRARHIAIRSRHHTWTYAALQRRARIIATNLVTRGITPGDRVALLFEHDAPMLAAILGTLQAGGVYVPIDPTFPADRIKHIVSDADATLILADTINFETAIATKRPAINIDELSASDAQLPTITPDAHAYILYTSGSTGQPKGVLQNHRNVLHHIRTYTNALRIQPRDHLSLIAAYGFDAAVMDIFGALLNGATLHPIDVKSESPESLARLLDDNAITIYHSTATVYRYLLGNNPSHRFNTIRTVVLGGEEVFRRDFDLFRTHFSEHAIFINGLGPTESTLALQYVMDHETELPRNAVPVGYPVPGTEVLLLDDSGHPVEGCGTGELAFRARHLALGYWRRPQLTAQAFSTHNGDASLRTYRTGDLARLLPDGRFEFLGRKDRQLKMRGVRIELGEVEARLLEHDAIREALVHVFEPTTGDRRLAAYYVPRNGDTPAPADLRAFLRERLPDVMVPSAFVSLASLPLLPNGKIDRDSLPKPDLSRLESTATFVAPTTPVEMLVASIWSSLLRVPRISVTDNFFDLGGHSLLATQLAARVRSTFHVDLPLREIFKTPTLSALAALIDASSTPHVVATPSIAKTARENYRVTVTHTGDLILPHALTIAHASELPTASAAPMLAPPQPQQRTAALSP
ncbi:MAG TPA: amino acid adenylation domain-containing protein [Thermoanaerobaculia bacterium]|nr:amino acid adenylation domain-containing protein [Thermoanaerobaculia bacterium]